jgi:hypothetical protein
MAFTICHRQLCGRGGALTASAPFGSGPVRWLLAPGCSSPSRPQLAANAVCRLSPGLAIRSARSAGCRLAPVGRPRTDLPPPSPRRNIAGLLLIRSPPYDGHSGPGARTMALLQPFPRPGRLVQLAYRQLDLATSRQQDHLLPLHDRANLQRPWDPQPARHFSCEARSGPGWRLSSPGLPRACHAHRIRTAKANSSRPPSADEMLGRGLVQPLRRSAPAAPSCMRSSLHRRGALAEI